MTRKTSKDEDGKRKGLLRRLWPVWLALGTLLIVAGALVLVPTDAPPPAEEAAGSASQTDNGDTKRERLHRALTQAGVMQGDPDAPVTIYEFGDYQCPACRQFTFVIDPIKAEYVASGRANFVFLDLPLTDLHEHAMGAALAARCAGRQDAYWSMHDKLFAEQPTWSDSDDSSAHFVTYAGELGLNESRFQRCLSEGLTQDAVSQSLNLAKRLGVSSTPTVIVGERAFSRPPSREAMRQAIEAQLPSGAPP